MKNRTIIFFFTSGSKNRIEKKENLSVPYKKKRKEKIHLQRATMKI